MPITYNPLFDPPPWIDGFHRVSAGGPDGLNNRMFSIAAEFDRISQVVADVDAAIGSLGQVVTAPVTVGIAPLLRPALGPTVAWSEVLWSNTIGGVPQGTYVESGGQDEAHGAVALDLPNGVKLTHLKTLGELTGGSMVTELFRESRTPPFDRTPLVQVSGFAAAGAAATTIPGSPVFTGDTHLFYLLAHVSNAAAAAVKLRGFQLTYQP